MHQEDITIDSISKIEGAASLKVSVAGDKVTDLKFIIQDYRRFYTEAVKGKPIVAVPSFLSRICGTCSLAHLFAAIKAIEKSQGIEVSEQTKILRRLAYDGLIIRDHTLHLYFWVLPDILGVDSILEIEDKEGDLGHDLLHDSFAIKKAGSDLSTAIAGAVVHAPLPTPGGFLKMPDPAAFPTLLSELKEIRPKILRGIATFASYQKSLVRNSDYMCLAGEGRYDFLEGEIINTTGRKVPQEEFHSFLKSVIIPYSQAEGYVFSDSHEDYLVGALARMNLKKDGLTAETRKDAADFLRRFPSNNVFDNNLAQAIEVLQAVDEAIEILESLKIVEERPVRVAPHEGIGVGVVEAPRGILYHMAEVNGKGMIANYDVIVPTSQNQINIENDLKKYFGENLSKERDDLKTDAEKIIRAYDPCMSCATNFLTIDWTEE